MGLSLAFLGLLLLAGPLPKAEATFEIVPGGFAVGLLDGEGHPIQAAGSHPDLLSIDFALHAEGTSARDIVFDLPPGLGLDAGAVPPCARAIVEAEEECPEESRVGDLEIVLEGGAEAEFPLFEIEGAAGEPVVIGTKPSLKLPLSSELRPDDFGITVRVEELPDGKIAEGHLRLWGVPADHQVGTSIPRRALLTAPSTCGALTFALRARSREEGAQWLSDTAETAPLGDCESLAFEPGLSVQLSDPVADTPTGLGVEMSMPPGGDPDERAQAQIKDVTVEMPAGLTVSPGGAQSLTACSDAELGLGQATEAHCPPSSRVGSVELFSPAIVGSLPGAIYLGQEQPGQRFRVFVVAGLAGTSLKFVGNLSTGTGDGRLSTVLHDLPPLSIERIAMDFDGGPNALFASPLECGDASATAEFVPYGGGPPAGASAQATIADASGGCSGGPPPFTPQLSTAASTPRAGRVTDFTSVVRRQQGEQLPGRLSVTMPKGLTARLGSVEACGSADVAAASCPAASRIGGVLAQVGSGPSSATLHGTLYLTGPYGRGPFGVLIELPAKIGPFDLGSISVRGAAELDRRTGRLTVAIDSIPATVEGVSVRFQVISLEMDRPGFIRNPTSCGPNETRATIEAQGGGTSAVLASPYEVRGCRGLAFGPTVRMSLFGAAQLHRGGKPGLRARVRLPANGAGLRSMRMSLPRALGFAIGGLRALCSHFDAEAGRCPAGSRIGSVQAHTSVLSEPLVGPVYAAQPQGRGSPDIWATVAAAGVQISFTGTSANRDGAVAFELVGLPDVPISSLSMSLRQGGNGVLALKRSPCSGGRPRRLGSTIAATGQNGKRRTIGAPIQVKARCGT